MPDDDDKPEQPPKPVERPKPAPVRPAASDGVQMFAESLVTAQESLAERMRQLAELRINSPVPSSALQRLRDLANSNRLLFDPEQAVAPLRREIERLHQAVAEQSKALKAATTGSEEQKRTIDTLTKTIDELEEKERLGFLLDRVHPDAQRLLRESQEFQNKFLASECSAFVMSVDIRRSTELMLKARSPQQFADFITALCTELTQIVLESFGVFDKFTGDGVLAFFPDFYSGRDAAYRVISAADKCHAAFKRHYAQGRSSFKTVLHDVGLGIGIDHGSVRLVRVAGGLTVVGEPVVYACRLSGAPAGETFVNQPAFEEISGRFGQYCFSEEQTHEVKHEGKTIVYGVRLNGNQCAPVPPDWMNSGTAENTQRG